MGNVVDIYPCQDSPLTCGWATSNFKDMIWEFEDSRYCNYPSCWCREWLVGSPLTNKTTEKGQSFISIIYRGSNPKLAEQIYNHLCSSEIRNTKIALADSRLSVLVRGINIVVIDGVYQVDITGELL